MNEILEKIAILFLGWLLGLLAPVIVNSIRQKRENTLGRKAILSELNDVSGVLAVATYAVRSKQGTVDRAHLQWLKTTLEKGERDSSYTTWIDRIEIQLSWTDDNIAEYFQPLKLEDGKGILLQKYPVPLLDSRVSALWSFETSLQRQLLEIRQLMHRLDSIVDRTYKLHDLSFSNLDELNRAILNENIKDAAAFYAESTQHVVDKVTKLLP